MVSNEDGFYFSSIVLYTFIGWKLNLQQFLSIIQIPEDFNCKRLIASNFVNNGHRVKLPFGIDGRYVG